MKKPEGYEEMYGAIFGACGHVLLTLDEAAQYSGLPKRTLSRRFSSCIEGHGQGARVNLHTLCMVLCENY